MFCATKFELILIQIGEFDWNQHWLVFEQRALNQLGRPILNHRNTQNVRKRSPQWVKTTINYSRFDLLVVRPQTRSNWLITGVQSRRSFVMSNWWFCRVILRLPVTDWRASSTCVVDELERRTAVAVEWRWRSGCCCCCCCSCLDALRDRHGLTTPRWARRHVTVRRYWLQHQVDNFLFKHQTFHGKPI